MPNGMLPKVFDEATADSLFAQLPSLYQRYTTDTRLIMAIFETFVQCANIVNDLINQVGGNFLINQTETMRELPFFPATLADSLYTDAEITELVPNWDALTLPQKVDALDSLGKYELIQTRRPWEQYDSDVVYLEVHSRVDEHTPFHPNEHWVLRNNKLYVFPPLATPLGLQRSKVVLDRKSVV